MHCDRVLFHLCWVEQATAPTGFLPSLFGFPQFMSALALLAVVYTVTDVRYRFRLAAAPVPLFPLTFALLIAIGIATLVTDVWIRERWLVLKIDFVTASRWEALWAALFLLLALTWIYFAFMRPARFARLNSFRYANQLYRYILKGSDTELPVVADELRWSAKPLITMSALDLPRNETDLPPPQSISKNRILSWFRTRFPRSRPQVDGIAHDILLMIGNRKFCRHLISSAPGTVIAILNEAGRRTERGIPLGQFARNISTEAIANKDSILYHEDEGYESGYFGYVKPFSEALYGDYELVERLGAHGFGSPLDVRHRAYRRWDAEQVEVYVRAGLMTFKDYLRKRRSLSHSFTLYRMLDTLRSICGDMYMFEPGGSDPTKTDTTRKFEVVMEFAADAVTAIDKESGLELGRLRVRDPNRMRHSFCDHLAEFMFKLLFLAATMKGDDFSGWHIQHNIAWDGAFGHHAVGEAHAAVAFKLRRLLYDEIRKLDRTVPNYKSARILGLCLYAMGLNPSKTGIDRNYLALKRVVLRWTRKNYLRLLRVQPHVAAACLVGSLSYDATSRRLVKTYAKGLSLEPPREYLVLDPAEESSDWLGESG